MYIRAERTRAVALLGHGREAIGGGSEFDLLTPASPSDGTGDLTELLFILIVVRKTASRGRASHSRLIVTAHGTPDAIGDVLSSFKSSTGAQVKTL